IKTLRGLIITYKIVVFKFSVYENHRLASFFACRDSIIPLDAIEAEFLRLTYIDYLGIIRHKKDT
ncbi:MAG: hypothetical protein ACI4LJ_07200, partial [Anaerovoracaceae bacterium]